jgi:hypothetical protein
LPLASVEFIIAIRLIRQEKNPASHQLTLVANTHPQPIHLLDCHLGAATLDEDQTLQQPSKLSHPLCQLTQADAQKREEPLS